MTPLTEKVKADLDHAMSQHRLSRRRHESVRQYWAGYIAAMEQVLQYIEQDELMRAADARD